MKKRIATILTTVAVWGTIATSAFAAPSPVVFSENGSFEAVSAGTPITVQQPVGYGHSKFANAGRQHRNMKAVPVQYRQQQVDDSHAVRVFSENGEYVAAP